MRVIIAGSRDISPSDEWISDEVEASGFEVTELVCGMCRGVDMCAKKWADARGIPVKPYYARWSYWRQAGQEGRAGPERNGWMAEYAAAGEERGGLIKFPGNRGTADMYHKARLSHLLIHEV